MIIFGIDNYNFQILHKLGITEHKVLSIEFLNIGKENQIELKKKDEKIIR